MKLGALPPLLTFLFAASAHAAPYETGEKVSYAVSQSQGEAMRVFAGAGGMLGGPDLTRLSAHGLLDVRPFSFVSFRGELMHQLSGFGDVTGPFTKVEGSAFFFLGGSGEGGFTTSRSASSISYVNIPNGSFERMGLDVGLSWDKHETDLALKSPVGVATTTLFTGLRFSRQEYFRADTNGASFFTNRRFDWYVHYERALAQKIDAPEGSTVVGGKNGLRGGLEWILGRPVALYAKLELGLNPGVGTSGKPVDLGLVTIVGLTSVLPLGY